MLDHLVDISQRLFKRFKKFCIQLFHTFEINEVTGMLFLGIFVGIACGFLAVGFREFLGYLQIVFFGVSEGKTFLETVQSLRWEYRLLIPAIGGLLVGPITHRYVQEAKGTGVPEVIESIVTGEGKIRWRVIPLKTILSSVTIGTGGSAGREGPIVQVGSSIGSAVGDFLDLSQTKIKTLIGCGAAGGIAGTFNAPLGGVIFSLEILLEDFHVSDFTSIIVSSVMSTAVCQRYFGLNPAFGIPSYSAELWELLPYAILGFICGILALLFTDGLYEIGSFFEEKSMIPPYLQPAAGGLLVGVCAIWVPHIYGFGYFVVETILLDEITLTMLILLLIFKSTATALTIGSGGSGGVFAPSLYLGAVTGALFGKILNLTFPVLALDPGSYALVGMGAFVAGTIHAPLTAVILLFEMTRDYTIILPLMFACLISTALNQSFHRYSIYTLKLFKRGLNIQSGKETNILKQIPVKEAMKSEVTSVNESDSIEKLKEVFAKSHHTHYPVIKDDSRKVYGVINYTRHWNFLEQETPSPVVICRDLARTPPVTVVDEDNLLTALEKITDFHVEILPVVDDEETQRLVGILSRNDIINSYNRELRKERKTETPLD